MKKYFKRGKLGVLAFLFFVVLSSNAQVFRGLAICGFNATQVDGDEVFGYKKYGWNVGAGVQIPFKDKWFISLENIYNRKGAYQPPRFTDSLSGEYRLILNYVEVPLLIQFEDKKTMTFGLGVSWGKLIEVKEYEHGNRVAATTLSGPYARSDWNFLGDVRFALYKRLKFNFRYAYSLGKIRTRTFNNKQEIWTRKQFNNLLTFRLIYVINEKISRKKKE